MAGVRRGGSWDRAPGGRVPDRRWRRSLKAQDVNKQFWKRSRCPANCLQPTNGPTWLPLPKSVGTDYKGPAGQRSRMQPVLAPESDSVSGDEAATGLCRRKRGGEAKHGAGLAQTTGCSGPDACPVPARF